MDLHKGRWLVELRKQALKEAVCVPFASKEASIAERHLRSLGTLDPHLDSSMPLSCCQELRPVGSCMRRAMRTRENRIPLARPCPRCPTRLEFQKHV